MNQHFLHSQRIWPAAFAAVLSLCSCGGCWEEIEYKGADATAGSRPVTTTADATERDNLAVDALGEPPQSVIPNGRDEKAVSQSVEARPEAAPDPASSATVNDAAAPGDNRYDMPSNGRYDRTNYDAQTVSATIEVPPPAVPTNTRRKAWLLGSKLSLAALANDRGVAAGDVPVWFGDARAAAESLQTHIDELPARPSSDGQPASREVLAYLLDHGKQVGRDLAASYGPDHAALFEVAVKSSLLLVLYRPGSSVVEHISAAITNAAPRAGLPPELWRPLLDTLAGGAAPADVRAAVRKLHADVDAYLATAVEP
jgi:hypothetical protein